jgi:flagellar protein FlaG
MAQTVQALVATPSPPTPANRPVDSKPKPKAKAEVEIQPKEVVPKESLDAAAKIVEDFLQQSSSYLKFGVDKDTGTYFFRIIDPVTQETIRQIPSEEILTMARKLRNMSDPKDVSGVLMDEEG